MSGIAVGGGFVVAAVDGKTPVHQRTPAGHDLAAPLVVERSHKFRHPRRSSCSS